MVASTNSSQNVASADSTSSIQTLSNGNNNNNNNNSSINAQIKTLPKGKYTLVGIDIDTTGRRLIDEIVQLAAYTPKDHFEQYIMPYMNLNPAARQRHQVRVISIGFYRMLKSMQTYKIIKSKSEIAALKDFLDWLEALKSRDAGSQGVILVYHEERKFIPYMILESLKKYNLLDRFLNTVKSFANGLNLAKANENESLQHYTLRKLSKVLSAKIAENAANVNVTAAAGDNDYSNVVSTTSSQPKNGDTTASQQQQQIHDRDRDLFDGNASVRAKLTYEVALQLSNLESKQSLDSTGAIEKLLTTLQPYAQPIDCDLNELQTQNENLERQNSFRPVFLNYFKTTLYHRVRAVKFRIILAEQGYDLQTLNAIWSERQRDGLIEVLHVIEELKEEDKTELVDLFDSYFDPAKTTIKPIVKNNNRRRNRRGIRNTINIKHEGSNNARPSTEQGAGGDKQVAAAAAAAVAELPDSTTKSPTPPSAATVNGGGKPQRGKRNGRHINNSLKSQNANANNNECAPATATAVPTNAPTVAAN